MSNRMKIKGEHRLRYNMGIWNRNYAFDILNDMIENFTLIDTFGNQFILKKRKMITSVKLLHAEIETNKNEEPYYI